MEKADLSVNGVVQDVAQLIHSDTVLRRIASVLDLDETQPRTLGEPFVTTKPGGLGMGLSIARSIVEGHGGRIWATNNFDRGATFHVALPAARIA